MEGLDPQTIIAIMTLMTGLGFLFNILLAPIKKNISELEVRLTNVEVRLTKLENRFTVVEQKIDQLLSKSA